jgi:phosphoglycolate phosphatase
MRTHLKAILFDLDGTLIETVHEIADSVNDTLRAIGDSQVLQSQVRDWIGHGTRELLMNCLAYGRAVSVAQIRELPGLSEVFALFDDFYLMRCGTRSYLYPQVQETLGVLKRAGVKMAIVTNKETKFTQALINAHHLHDYFDVVVCGDTLDTKKPNPAGIEFCLKEFGAKTDESIFIGDSFIDAKTAQNAGMRVWLMPYGYNMGEPLDAALADHLASGFGEILRLIDTF